jgi:hypothetical protein
MPSINESGSESTLREAIAAMLGHRVPVEGGWATAVIDLSYSSDDHRPRKRRKRRPRPGMPVLTGRASESGRLLIVWCPFCGEHAHGRHGAIEDCGPECPCVLHAEYTTRSRVPCTCPAGSGDGHRVSHCRPGSPLLVTGYWVEEVAR